MSRRGRVPTREMTPDSVYQDKVVSKFINYLMMGGEKAVAERIFYNAMGIIEEKTKEKGIDIFRKALDNVKPVLEVKSRRIGGATYSVPMEVRPARVQSLTIRWLIKYSRDRKETKDGMAGKLARELMEASRSEGGAVGKKEDVHRMAEANKAFAHYKW